MKLTLTPEQEKEVVNHTSGKVTLADGKEFFYMPRWFTKNEDGTWERLSFDELPDEAKEQMSSLRSWLKNIIP